MINLHHNRAACLFYFHTKALSYFVVFPHPDMLLLSIFSPFFFFITVGLSFSTLLILTLCLCLSLPPSLLCTQFLFLSSVLLSLLSHCQHSFSVANQCKLRKTIMKDKTNGCCVLSCASLVLNIVLLDMIDGSLSSGNTSLLPDCTQAAIHNG